jgi:undecaprenyl-diphosphatase
VNRTSAGRLRAVATLAIVACAPATPVWCVVTHVDNVVLAQVVRWRRAAWRRPAAVATELAAPAFVVAAVAATTAYARRRAVPATAIGEVVTVAGLGLAVRRALAEVVRRDRPAASLWWSEPSGFSYPSRHVTWAVLGFGAVADLLAAAGTRQRVVRTTRAAPGAVVAATRVLLAVHWPSDVAAAVGFSVAYRDLATSISASPHVRSR